jgi:hypothetical protein
MPRKKKEETIANDANLPEKEEMPATGADFSESAAFPEEPEPCERETEARGHAECESTRAFRDAETPEASRDAESVSDGANAEERAETPGADGPAAESRENGADRECETGETMAYAEADSADADSSDAYPEANGNAGNFLSDAESEAEPSSPESALVPQNRPRPASARKKTIADLDLNALDRNLSEEQMREWNAVYASYRAKSLLSGTVVGVDETSFEIRNRETGETEKKKLNSLIVIEYRVKILIPESETWMPGEERPGHVLRNMVGGKTDYAIMEIDREGECAIASRRVALAAKRHFFAKGEHREGELLKCRVMAVGAKQCTVECNGFDIRLTQRDLSYASVADLREKYRPGHELSCVLKSYDRKEGRLEISVKEVNPNPFVGADGRHPIGSRRQAVISGKYGGGVFCTLPDDTVCLCLYSAGHSDADFRTGDSVIIAIRQYDYARQLIYGRILAKW